MTSTKPPSGIDEVTDPEEDPRKIPVHNLHKIQRNADIKTLPIPTATKGQVAELDDTDMDNVENL